MIDLYFWLTFTGFCAMLYISVALLVREIGELS